MKTMQTIAIIGASGNMGSAISRGLAKGNYRLLLCANDLDKVQTVADEIKSSHPGAEVAVSDCSRDASWEADIIIAAVPYTAEREVAEKVKDVANQKIVISIANPLNDAYDGLVSAPDTSAAEELQKLLPNAKVVKAFNTTFAADFATPVIDGKQADAFVAGDDQEALQTVVELVETVGFNPIVAGGLAVSGTLERMQLLLIQLNMKNGYNWLAGRSCITN
ncbi:NADPH-dependent F420 reductase [Pontibacter sp. BAB1700]|uniref:NADPH-dependent F420 reductase n=1 Tax=Pontibacter sp. BAB1700 TaxID=1144253 RepID=UPI0005915108|nr:NADPH-dependent F420 reductase [Pontibacter sp. BAB1700]